MRFLLGVKLIFGSRSMIDESDDHDIYDSKRHVSIHSGYILVHNSYIYVRNTKDQYDIYKYKLNNVISVKKNYILNGDSYHRIIHDHYITYDNKYLIAINIHNGARQDICMLDDIPDRYYELLFSDKLFIYINNSHKHVNYIIKYINGVFIVCNKIESPSFQINPHDMYETKKYIYWINREWDSINKINYYNTIKYCKLSKMSEVILNDIPICMTNGNYYFNMIKNKIIIIDQNDNIKTYLFPYSHVGYIHCNNKYFCHTYERKLYIHDMKMQLIKIINKQVSSIDNRIIVFNTGEEVYPIIPLTYKIKKLFVNTSYKHILRMVI